MTSVEERSALKTKPYLERRVSCPFCSKIGEHPEVKTRLFVERDRDVDLRPKTYIWNAPLTQECHPPLYYMWSCPHCYFTAASLHFTNPAKAHNLPTITFRTGILNAAARWNARQVAEILTAGTKEGPLRSFSTGLALHLLALFQLEGIDEVVSKETITFGKHYLRTAWLFRDLKERFPSEEEGAVKELLHNVKACWSSAPLSEHSCLEKAALLLEQGLETSSAIVTMRDEIELILLIARIWMMAGDPRRAKNFGAFSREKLLKFETALANDEIPNSRQNQSEVRRLKSSQAAVFTLLSEMQNEALTA